MPRSRILNHIYEGWRAIYFTIVETSVVDPGSVRIRNFLPDPDLDPLLEISDPGLDPKLDVNINKNHKKGLIS
jgi:hypothetical protein